MMNAGRTYPTKMPIINSMLQTDLYKINMGSVFFHEFPNAWVTYKFFNRGDTKFPDGFAKELNKQIRLLSKLKLTKEEEIYLLTIPYLRRTYIEWFASYSYDPREVSITQSGGDLDINITGFLYRTTHWEVVLMALISELYFKMTNQVMEDNWFVKISQKAKELSEAECHWIDFGTRRRFSSYLQGRLVQEMRKYKGFLGTSNPYFAMKYGVKAQGTYAHEPIMAMSALYGPSRANHEWQRLWSKHFDGDVGIALTDTFTTDVFLRDFGKYEARLYDGVRQDSGDPYEWGYDMRDHYKSLGINPTSKKFVFSDALTTEKYLSINNEFKGIALPVGGIGTHFTNDVGVEPLNIVIKMVLADFGYGARPVVKLSDDAGKNTGDKDEIKRVKEQLSIV